MFYSISAPLSFNPLQFNPSTNNIKRLYIPSSNHNFHCKFNLSLMPRVLLVDINILLSLLVIIVLRHSINNTYYTKISIHQLK